MKYALFERFELPMPDDAVEECSHQGDCMADVQAWENRIERPAAITPEALRAELREYGAWDDDELADDAANWRRLIWIAAGNIQEEDIMAEREAVR